MIGGWRQVVPRAVAVAAVAVAALAVAAWFVVLVWNTQNHVARVLIVWLGFGSLVVTAAWLRVPRTMRRPSVLIASAWLYLLGLVSLLVIVFGWTISFIGLVVGIPVTALALLAQRRAMSGHVDGPFLTAAMLAGAGVLALTRPWTPKTPQWLWAAAVSFAAAAVVLADVLMWPVLRRAASRADGANEAPGASVR